VGVVWCGGQRRQKKREDPNAVPTRHRARDRERGGRGRGREREREGYFFPSFFCGARNERLKKNDVSGTDRPTEKRRVEDVGLVRPSRGREAVGEREREREGEGDEREREVRLGTRNEERGTKNKRNEKRTASLPVHPSAPGRRVAPVLRKIVQTK
jgi:hypothetical protein